MPIVKCDGCGAGFGKPPSAVSRQNFCSRECRDLGRRGESNPNWKGGLKQALCPGPGCGKPFEDAGYTGKKFCSRGCAHRSFTRKRSEADALSLIREFTESAVPFYEFARAKGLSEFTLRKRLKEVAPDDFEAAMERRRVDWDEVYRTGRKFEYETRRALVALRYVCMVSPRSLGPADLMAARAGVLLLIQCKSGSGRIRKSEKAALMKCAEDAGGIPIVATPGPTFWRCLGRKTERYEP